MIKSDLAGLQVLVIGPTREIAMQGLQVATQIGSCLPDVKIASFIGGMPLSEDRLKAQHCHLAVGTPGRITQLLTENILCPNTIRLVILDEADKLLEPNFIEETSKILNLLPQNKQVLALSATYPDELATLAEKFMRSPQHIRLGKESQVLHGVAQFVMEIECSPVQQKQNQIKQSALLKILSSVSYNQCLIFSNYQLIAQSTADFLNSRGFPAIFISAGQEQVRRLQAIQTFKSFKCRILCSTDLTARGIDAENVNLVINIDVPKDHNTYLHRIGRGGRFGSSSIAISLAAQGKDLTSLQRIVSLTQSSVKVLPPILPKDIRQAQLPLLDGLTQDELTQLTQVVVDKPSGSTNCAIEEERIVAGGDQEHSLKEGNKVERRGKKKTKATANTENPLQVHQTIFVEPPKSPSPESLDHVAQLNLLLGSRSTRTNTIGSFEELCRLPANEASLSHPKTDNLKIDTTLYELGKHFQQRSSQRRDKFQVKLNEIEKHLNYRSLPDVLLQVKNNFDVSQMNGTVHNHSRQSNCDTSGPPSIASCISSEEEDNEQHSQSLPISQPAPIGPQFIPQPNQVAGELQTQRSIGLTEQYLRSWIQNVERQRQIIQDREYWRVVQHYRGIP